MRKAALCHRPLTVYCEGTQVAFLRLLLSQGTPSGIWRAKEHRCAASWRILMVVIELTAEYRLAEEECERIL